MKKNLLTIAVIALGFASATAQSAKIKLKNNHTKSNVNLTTALEEETKSSIVSENAKSARVASTYIVADTNNYFSTKRSLKTPPSFPYGGRFTLPDAYFPTTTHYGNLYYNASPVSVSGLGFQLARKSTSQNSSVEATIILCELDNSYNPILPGLDSISATISSTVSSRYYGTFANPHILNSNFAVLVRKSITASDNDTIYAHGFYTKNPASFSTTATWNFDDGCGLVNDGGIYYNMDLGNNGIIEFDTRIIYSTTVAASFSSVASGSCAPVTYTNTSTSQEIYENPFFNFNAFMAVWQPTMAVNGSTIMPTYQPVYTWDANNGDALAYNTNSITPTYTAGVYTSSLTTNFKKFWNFLEYADLSTNTFTVDVCTGINNATANVFTIFPNPSNGIISIKNIDYNSTIELYNVLGEMLYKEKANSDNVSFDFSKLASGNYYLKVITAEGKSTVKKLHFN
jgi:hypothetical protein